MMMIVVDFLVASIQRRSYIRSCVCVRANGVGHTAVRVECDCCLAPHYNLLVVAHQYRSVRVSRGSPHNARSRFSPRSIEAGRAIVPKSCP